MRSGSRQSRERCLGSPRIEDEHRGKWRWSEQINKTETYDPNKMAVSFIFFEIFKMVFEGRLSRYKMNDCRASKQ